MKNVISNQNGNIVLALMFLPILFVIGYIVMFVMVGLSGYVGDVFMYLFLMLVGLGGIVIFVNYILSPIMETLLYISYDYLKLDKKYPFFNKHGKKIIFTISMIISVPICLGIAILAGYIYHQVN